MVLFEGSISGLLLPARSFQRMQLVTVGADELELEIAPPESEANYCRGLAVDSQGVVYVAATGSRRVLKLTPGGDASTVLQAPSPWSPTGVALFGGEVYVLEWQDAPPSLLETRNAWIPRVRKVGRDGKITTLATISREPTPRAAPKLKQ